MDRATYARLNIYLDDPALRQQVRLAAARQGVSLSAYCLEAIRRRLAAEGSLTPVDGESNPGIDRRHHAAEALDRLRRGIGRVGVPVADLIAEGRRR